RPGSTERISAIAEERHVPKSSEQQQPSRRLSPTQPRQQVSLKVSQSLDLGETDVVCADAKNYNTHFCYRRGEACAKNKRALEELSSVVDKIQSDYDQDIQE
ncbi:MAG: hypothetical protein Q9168_001856, partial [Polycauliona sp. 1 TL-2023]